MLGQRTARRLAPLKPAHRDPLACRRCGRHLRRHLGRGGILLEIGQLQLELFERRATLRGLTELRMPQPGDGELQLLDQQRAILRLALRRGGLRLRRKQRLALREDDRVGSCHTDSG